MIRLLLKADDLGYSEAVNLGIERALRAGIVKSTALMANMPAATHGIGLIRGYDIAIGQHTNICVGRPVCNPKDIPSLVDDEGNFKTSSVYRASDTDFVVYDEVRQEIEAQLMRFRMIVGRDPDYFEGHAVASNQFFKALRDVAEDQHLKLCMPALSKDESKVGKTKVRRCVLESMSPDYDPFASLKHAVETAPDESTNIFTCHPGYLDNYILQHSSLTINRTREVVMLTDPNVCSWIIDNKINLIDFRDL